MLNVDMVDISIIYTSVLPSLKYLDELYIKHLSYLHSLDNSPVDNCDYFI